MTLLRRDAIGLTAAALLVASPRAARAQATKLQQRWHPGDAPPEVEGIHLGDTRERVEAVLGPADPAELPDDPAADLQTLRYRGGALMIAVSRTGGVSRILLNRPDGGALAGIRVGDHLGRLLLGWGEPTQSRGSVGRYEMGAWTITVRADLGDQKVLKLMLGPTPPPVPPNLPPPPPPADAAPPAGATQPAQ